LSTAALVRSTYLLYFSQPAADRPLYKAIKGRAIRSFVELGIGAGQRTERLIEVLGWEAGNLPLAYTGIDLFEQRPSDCPGMSLKAAFAKMKFAGVKTRLVPGDPYSALSRAANQLSGTDLIVISADQDRDSLARAWFYFPRMMHAGTLVFLEEPAAKGTTTYRPISPLEIERLAASANRTLRRAA
jgi:hypothetical protein